jgi:hypothetical protein
MIDLSTAEKLMHTTVRLECELTGDGVSTGTGFFFAFKVDDGRQIPLIVTNKHVIDGAAFGTFVLTKRADDGSPQIGTYETIKLDNFESLWIKHSEDDVDLAVFPIAPLLRSAESKKISFFYLSLDESLIPNEETNASLGGIEDIIMIGYPNGIWNTKNNMPIVRRGITATNPKVDYNGLPQFVIDCACFPGSSGSPVLIFNQGGYTDAKGCAHIGASRVILMGVLFAGPQHVAKGEIQTIDIPLQQVPVSLSRISNNLGFVVKSIKLNDFRATLESRGL